MFKEGTEGRHITVVGEKEIVHFSAKTEKLCKLHFYQQVAGE
jgi:hypothetical protein